MATDDAAPALAFGLDFSDLYAREGLERVDAQFLTHVREADPELHARLSAARAAPAELEPRAEADLLVALAPHLEDYVGILFDVHAELQALAAQHHALAPLFACKRLFVQRRAAKAFRPEEAASFDGPALAARLAALGADPEDELAFATVVTLWGGDEKANAAVLDLALRYAAWAVHSEAGRERHRAGHLFKVPARQDPMRLVDAEAAVERGVSVLRFPDGRLRRRDGFALTDPGDDLAGALDEIHYCILCHHQGKDSCSRGMRDRATGAFAVNPLGTAMTGCPLEEKISEMHEVKGQGLAVAALAMAVVDNPMVAGTGHRICNDCMTACIYHNQNKEPVDIPQAETRALKDVLSLPWGVEIYGLLTRWNPLDLRRPLPRPDSGRKVLVVGLGPAGFTLAHHLLNDGHTVVAVDGLKIEPLAPELSGVTPTGARVAFRPIRDVADLAEPLDSRVMAGFGGVAEYGITVRWDKNFLKVIRLLLERRTGFAMYGGVRLGGTLTPDSAFAMGFDHVALCMGAGKPTILSLPNGLARGVRQASDFLMALQLTGAARADSVANLQVRLPVVVIGGGLTAIDTCTEALAYYPVQVEKFLSRYEILAAERGEAAVRAAWSEEDGLIADEFLGHARAIRAERDAAAREGRAPRLGELLQAWGGATIAYRRKLTDSPAYRNHEEVDKAMEEGIRFAEGLTPLAVEVDRFGHADGLRVRDAAGDETVLPARAILVAAGTVPNTTLAREQPGIELDGKYFRAVDADGRPVTPLRIAKPEAAQVLMHVDHEGRGMSFFGDLHPSYAGNVVKAMASAKQGYPVVTGLMERRPASPVAGAALIARLDDELRAVVHEVTRLTPTIVEVVVRAPLAARTFRPGQFYRLQNYETLAAKVGGTTLAMEGLALTGAWVDAERGLVSLIVLEMGGSSDLCQLLTPGEPVVLMGPTGSPTEIPEGETVLLAGGGLGNAVLFSIGQAMRRAGSKVLYFAGYRRPEDRFKVGDIEAAADVVVWCTDIGPALVPGRPQDRAFVGNIVAAMASYAEGRLGDQEIPLAAADRLIAIGSDRMMAAVAAARHGVLAPHLKPDHVAIGSINSPMQCMMKEICAQCLQTHVDPRTGERRVVFSCSNQDQPLDLVDFPGLEQRLAQNAVEEKLTRLWIDRCLRQLGARAD
ncbi:MAG: FAD-dependent oxidoreductase [Rhodospirillales bacterium]|nr:FAD-dependent oxidoreductase [Rhodospirillales bacterium]